MSTKIKLSQVWAELIEVYKANVSNVKTWCRNNNFSARQYYYWIRKLNNTSTIADVIEGILVQWLKYS